MDIIFQFFFSLLGYYLTTTQYYQMQIYFIQISKVIMAEGGAAYFMLDINCGSKNLHSGFIKVDKSSVTVGDLISYEVPEGHLISEVYIAEGEGKKRRRAHRYGFW